MHVGEEREAASYIPLRTPANGFGDVAVFRRGGIGWTAAMTSNVLLPLPVWLFRELLDFLEGGFYLVLVLVVVEKSRVDLGQFK